MNRWTVLLATMVIFTLVALGCSGGGNPVAPTSEPDLAVGVQSHESSPQTHLWGFYDVYIDIETQTVEYVANRQVMFTANVVQFVNNNPANLAFAINSTPVGVDYVDVDIDVSITHPFPGLTEYNGYDVKGIFIGDASESLDYNGDLDYAVLGTDQFMQDFDEGGDGLIYGNPDGYTRWWNPMEFTVPGVLGYTEGKVATPGYKGTATLNPYKYFADGLTKADDLWEWLNANATTNGVVSAGSTNTRNYYLRFPNLKGIRYNYAIAANWIDETTHPANAPEAPTISCEVTPDIYWVPPSGADKGGSLILDVHVWGWDGSLPSTIYVESTVLSAVYGFDSTDMTPVGGDVNYSTYHAEILADNITGLTDQEFWVICEYPDYDYTNTFGVTNLAGTDPLAALFRYDLFVADVPYNKPPVVDTGVDGEDNPLIIATETYSVTAHDDDGDPLSYSWTVTDNSTSAPVPGYDGVPGDGAGNLDVDWAGVGAADLDEYDIDCDVSDGIAPPVPATTLTVTGTNIIYYWNGDDDDGGWSQISYGYGANWGYTSNVWDENGNTSNVYTGDMCRTLLAPAIDIPSGTYNLHLELTHSGRGPGYAFSPTMYSLGGYIVGYSTNAGGSINFDRAPCSGASNWLTFVSGQNYNFPYSYGNLGLINKSCHGCSWSSTWQNRAFSHHTAWGSMASPVTSHWTCNGLKGTNDVQYCFNAHSANDYGTPNGTGWQLHELKLYVVP